MAAVSSKGVFKGASEEHLTALIEACNAPRPSAPLPGFGRELVPYFGSSEPAMDTSSTPKGKSPAREPRAGSKQNKRKGSPQQLQRPSTATAGAPPSASPAKERMPNNRPSSARESTPAQQRVAGNKQRQPMSKAPASAPIAVPLPPNGKASAAKVPAMGASPPARPGFACPAFFSSPKPETLPMPSSLLTKLVAAA